VPLFVVRNDQGVELGYYSGESAPEPNDRIVLANRRYAVTERVDGHDDSPFAGLLVVATGAEVPDASSYNLETMRLDYAELRDTAAQERSSAVELRRGLTVLPSAGAAAFGVLVALAPDLHDANWVVVALYAAALLPLLASLVIAYTSGVRLEDREGALQGLFRPETNKAPSTLCEKLWLLDRIERYQDGLFVRKANDERLTGFARGRTQTLRQLLALELLLLVVATVVARLA
jgi:hypothetical protein